ncbi:MAG: diaminopimelate epimerase [Gammaproteobacteria bacterium]|nr:diaminopimelate epimerase [Gammaproteobacteria bacterium]
MLKFSKMHGLGNDFVVIDAINQSVALSETQIQFLANRHLGIGCDQLLLVERPTNKEADFKYRIFNADGGEVAQCGNGARCFARFVYDKGLTDQTTIAVETVSGIIYPSLLANGDVRVDMGMPHFKPADIPFIAQQQSSLYDLNLAGGEDIEIGVVSMGNPHAVLLVDDIEEADVARLGPMIEGHKRFPEHVNAGFMEVINPDEIRLRVFERGVGETQACGTGACAAVVSGIKRGLLAREVKVSLLGGELTISWPADTESVQMTGPTEQVFDGEIAWAMINSQ